MSAFHGKYYRLRRPILLLALAISVAIQWHLYSLFLERSNNFRTESKPREFPQGRTRNEISFELAEDEPAYFAKDQDDLEEPRRQSDRSLRQQLKIQPARVRQKNIIPLANVEANASDTCEQLGNSAEFLPDFIYIPFEEAVSEDSLDGWEDAWVSAGTYDTSKWGSLEEPKIDILYTWVNGSEEAFGDVIRPYEIASPLNDPAGVWLSRHGTNRYRDWDELRYSIRSVSKYASSFVNKIQILVNFIGHDRKQRPQWLRQDGQVSGTIEVLAHEEFFEDDKKACLPTFNSLTIENQIFNTKSDTDKIFVLSDDMLLTTEHSASDIYSPLLGPTMGFKTNSYNIIDAPIVEDTQRFGEKPFLIYTSWLLNRRFGERKRKGQAHFGHSISRSVAKEVMKSFPRPSLKSASRRFRGESGPKGELGFQLYSWYSIFHYTIERHREALLWSYIMHRSDIDSDGSLSWPERQHILTELEEGISHEGSTIHRARNFFHVDKIHHYAGLAPPKSRSKTLWTSLDGPLAIQSLECPELNTDECLAPGFSISSPDAHYPNPLFTTATIFDRVARQKPRCGDCLLKILLNRAERGLDPLLPDAATKPHERETVVKALMRYKYSVVEPNAWFEMITDAEQLEARLTQPLVRAEERDRPVMGQLCLNDDVVTRDEVEIEKLRWGMKELFEGLLPEKSPYEI